MVELNRIFKYLAKVLNVIEMVKNPRQKPISSNIKIIIEKKTDSL